MQCDGMRTATMPDMHQPMRRHLLLAALSCGAGLSAPAYALPPAALRFPRDLGSHPDFGTEWWYITGQALATTGNGKTARPFGFQLTFFRSRVEATQQMRSQFAARQLLFAHAALTDVAGKRLWHDQRIAREGFDIAVADTADTGIRLQDWSLLRQGGGLQATLPARDFGLHLRFDETQPLLLQGDQGLSRKGPDAAQASYYYSLPQLAVRGHLDLQGQRFDLVDPATQAEPAMRSVGWLDHEWSQALLHPEAVGWDWIGMNLLDGSALTAFRLRRKNGSTLWDGGSFRAAPASSAAGKLFRFSPGEVSFSPQRFWKSPLSQASYPVEWIVRTPADFYTVKAVLDQQELDSRQSTGAIYWEGLSELFDSNGRLVGRGYLEMTGYAQPLRL